MVFAAEVAEELDRPMTKTLKRMGSRSSKQRWSTRELQSIDMVGELACNFDIDAEEVTEELDRLLDLGEAGSVRSRISPFAFVLARTSYTVDPHSILRTTHDLLSLLVLAVEIIRAFTILAWDLEEVAGSGLFISYISCVFWSIDIVLNCVTGFYHNGELELRPRQVAMRYLCSWFITDVIVVAADITLLMSGDSTFGSEGVLRISKASRFVRLVRFIRMAKALDVFARLMEASVFLETVVEFLKPTMGIMLINHMLACVWWAVGTKAPSDTKFRWVDEGVSPGAEVTFTEASFWYQYFTCMHWSMAQMTVGAMDIAPRNAYERAVNYGALVMGTLIFSGLVSTISAMMLKHYLKKKDQLTHLASLRRFLQARVKQSTVINAAFHAKSAMFGTGIGKPVLMDEVDAILMLPLSLQRDIRTELCEGHLKHPLFRWLFVIDFKGAQTLCQTAIDFVGLAKGGNLFLPRAIATGAYVMASGSANYIINDGPNESDRCDVVVCEDQFFCEIALWCTWKHIGEMTASTSCELLLIRGRAMMNVLEQKGVVWRVAGEYGRCFAARLKASFWSEVDVLPDDVVVPQTEFVSILLTLPADCQQLIGAAAVQVNHRMAARRDLRDQSCFEVRDGLSCFTLTWQGEVERIASSVELRLSGPCNRILMQVGQDEANDIRESSCHLPGCRQLGNETSEEAFARLLQGFIAPFVPAVEFTGAGLECEEFQAQSQRLQVKTRYVKLVREARLTCPTESLGLEATRLGAASTIRGSTNTRSSNTSRAPKVSNRFSDRRSRTGWGSITGSVSISGSGPIVFEDDLEVFAVADEAGDISFVSWLSPEEVRVYQSRAGQAAMRCLLKKLHLTPELAEIARARFAAAPDILGTSSV